jgi:DMSO/TMAO reductase YedYZ molybdopterin-dependent catalytic subunit
MRREPRMRRSVAATVGVLAAAVALGVTELVAGLLPGGRSPFVAVGDAVIGLTPGPVVAFAISTFGGSNRLVLVSSMAVGLVVAGALVGVGGARRRWIGAVGIGVFGLLGAAVAQSDPLVPALTAVVAPGLGATMGVLALFVLLRAGVRATSTSPDVGGTGGFAPSPQDRRIASGSRRGFLVLATSVAGSAVVSTVVGRSLQARTLSETGRTSTRFEPVVDALPTPSPATRYGVPGISPLITPNTDFFRIDTALTLPRIDPSTHRVRFSGLVDHPFELTYGELLDLADTEADITLSCVSNEVGGDLVGTARWRGVLLADLLERAGVQVGATQLVGRSVDGWTSGFPVEAALDGRNALVAVGMNGEPLPLAHGFPVRLVIPGLYGYVSNTKWLAEVELTTFEAHEAYWIPRGWARLGPIKTQSRIDVPSGGAALAAGRVVIAGVAWSDEHGVGDVEVAIDDGPWMDAEVADELAVGTWRQWRFAWDATPGDHLLRVRASDSEGRVQTAERSSPAPDGATGHHTVRVNVA